MADWRWDDTATRYRDQVTGRFLSRQAVDGFITESISTASQYSEGLASILGDGQITSGGWYAGMRQEIKEEYIRQYLLGHGGLEQMTQSDWGSIGGMISEQYKYLEGFYQEVLTGNLSPEMIAARSDMYLNSAREAFERAQDRLASDLGYDEESWNVDPSVENCDDCLAFAAMGWVKADDDPYGGAFPGSGDTQCLTNCHCWIDHRQAETGQTLWGEE